MIFQKLIIDLMLRNYFHTTNTVHILMNEVIITIKYPIPCNLYAYTVIY